VILHSFESAHVPYQEAVRTDSKFTTDRVPLQLEVRIVRDLDAIRKNPARDASFGHLPEKVCTSRLGGTKQVRGMPRDNGFHEPTVGRTLETTGSFPLGRMAVSDPHFDL
jgi:hypothetical protein